MQAATTILCQRCNAEISIDVKPHPPITIQRFRSLDTPSDVEVAQIRPVIKDCQRDLDRYSEEIQKLSETLATLKRQRDELQTYRDRQSSFISPVRKLPVEILANIFSLCCDSGLVIDKEISAPALTLSHTCSFWRRVTLSRPELWSTLSVDLHKFRSGAEARLHELLALFLDRSETGSGICLEVSAYDDNEYYAHALDPEGWSAFVILLRGRNRWKEVSFELSWDLYTAVSYVGISVFLEGSDLGNLEHLSVGWLEDQRIPPNKPPFFFNILTHAPSLQSLCIQGLYDHRNFEGLPVNSAKKLSITESIVRFSDLFWLLERCAGNCEEIDFSTWGILDTEQFNDLPEITLPNLQSLDYRFGECETGSKVLSALTLPSLTTLTLGETGVKNTPAPRQAMFRNFKAMIERSSCRLKNLTLEGRLFESDKEWIAILNLIPTVEKLMLDVRWHYGSILTEDFFDALCFNSMPGQRIILPCLGAFSLSFQEEPIWLGGDPRKSDSLPNPRAMISMIESRAVAECSVGNVQRLQCFAVNSDVWTRTAHEWMQNFDSDTGPRLRELEKAGLRLSLNMALQRE
ncbi:hypothetical protein VKT23_017403 [Stygiomarasmius scandens]|uniref:F-box domain-containing protein n=1 Tax=Marasmiellus scandens TaxID=2682957 RepID=A0ABR1ISI1_9AGAR